MSGSPKNLGVGLLTALSLAANVVLLARLEPTRSAAPGQPAQRAIATSDSPGLPHASDSMPARSGVPPTLWAQLESSDLRELGRSLLAAGFPPRVVRAVLTERFERPWREQSAQAREAAPYWRTPAATVPPQPLQEIHARERERQRLFDEVFGSTQAHLLENNPYSDSGYGFLAPEKAAQVLSIQRDYMELMTTDGPKTAAEITAWDQRRKLLEDQQRADLAAILTPEELYEYDLRTSATRITIQPKFMELTETEYRALFAIFHEPVTALTARVADAASAPRQTQAELFESLGPQIRAVLGDARSVEYLQAMDLRSEKLNRVAARFDLPLAAAAQVAAARREATARANAIRRDAELPPAQRTAALASLQADTTAKITAAFGARAAEAYLSYDGKWLGQLTAPPRP